MPNSPKNIFAVVLDKIRAATQVLVAEGLLPDGLDQSRVQVEPPREPGTDQRADADQRHPAHPWRQAAFDEASTVQHA